MAQSSKDNSKWEPVIESYVVDGTGDTPTMKITLDDGTVMRFTQQDAYNLIGAFDDLLLDKIEQQRNRSYGV